MGAGVHERALAAAQRAGSVRAEHRATLALARRYAQLLDAARMVPSGDAAQDASRLAAEADVYGELGPKYLAALAACGLTVAPSKGVTVAAGTPTPAATALEQLRAARAERAPA